MSVTGHAGGGTLSVCHLGDCSFCCGPKVSAYRGQLVSSLPLGFGRDSQELSPSSIQGSSMGTASIQATPVSPLYHGTDSTTRLSKSGASLHQFNSLGIFFFFFEIFSLNNIHRALSSESSAISQGKWNSEDTGQKSISKGNVQLRHYITDD